MKKIALVLAFAMASLLPSQSYARGSDYRLVLGPGGKKCSFFLRSDGSPNPHDQMNVMLVMTWVQGFLSSLNNISSTGGDPVHFLTPEIASSEHITRSFARICRKDPQKRIFSASSELFLSMLKDEVSHGR